MWIHRFKTENDFNINSLTIFCIVFVPVRTQDLLNVHTVYLLMSYCTEIYTMHDTVTCSDIIQYIIHRTRWFILVCINLIPVGTCASNGPPFHRNIRKTCQSLAQWDGTSHERQDATCPQRVYCSPSLSDTECSV